MTSAEKEKYYENFGPIEAVVQSIGGNDSPHHLRVAYQSIRDSGGSRNNNMIDVVARPKGFNRDGSWDCDKLNIYL